jgi:DNA polymerase III delta subunit
MTATANNKLTALFATLSTEKLIESFELTEGNKSPEIPMVRAWMMDEMERRNFDAFEAWLEGDANLSPRQYFL